MANIIILKLMVKQLYSLLIVERTMVISPLVWAFASASSIFIGFHRPK